MVMTDYDLNGNGKIDPDEREIMLEDRRRKMEDADAKRDAQRRMTWFALLGMLLYPVAILVASLVSMGDAAKLIADIATVYVVAASGVVAAYFGFNAMEAKK
jgi:hypothetical protein